MKRNAILVGGVRHALYDSEDGEHIGRLQRSPGVDQPGANSTKAPRKVSSWGVAGP